MVALFLWRKADGGSRLAVRLGAGAESWPNFKFGADRNLLSHYAKVGVRLYIRAESIEAIDLNIMPDGGVNRVEQVKTNEWITLELTVEEILAEYEWSPTDGISYTNLFWFTNASGNTVSEVWVAGFELIAE